MKHPQIIILLIIFGLLAVGLGVIASIGMPTHTADVCNTFSLDLIAALRRQMATARRLDMPVEKSVDFDGGIKLKLVLIPAGEFMMGSPEGETGRSDTEGPQRKVTITEPFYMGIYPITQAQYQEVTGKKPDLRFKGDDLPVYRITWNNAVEFCKKLSERTGLKFRLPTEAEWEYAARAGTTTAYYFGNNEKQLGEYAWHAGNSDGRVHPSGQKKPNAWGLYDMYGNVFEWCLDWYQDTYKGLPDADPTGPPSGEERVLRGGVWFSFQEGCRSAYRRRSTPGGWLAESGLRVVMVPSDLP